MRKVLRFSITLVVACTALVVVGPRAQAASSGDFVIQAVTAQQGSDPREDWFEVANRGGSGTYSLRFGFYGQNCSTELGSLAIRMTVFRNENVVVASDEAWWMSVDGVRIEGNARYETDDLIRSAGSIRVSVDGVETDRVGWGDTAPSCAESAPAPTLAPDSSLVRIDREVCSVDTGNNAADVYSVTPDVEDTRTNECPVDTDGDGLFDEEDNCVVAVNPSQQDTDLDGQGDACDEDDDDDGVQDGADNCHVLANPTQTNTDGDAQGNACDADDDNDGLSDSADRCPTVRSPNGINGCPMIARDVTLGYSDALHGFTGVVQVSAAECRAWETVHVYKVKDGNDTYLGRDVTDENGRYVLRKTRQPGTYYARADANTEPATGFCQAARSANRTLG